MEYKHSSEDEPELEADVENVLHGLDRRFKGKVPVVDEREALCIEDSNDEEKYCTMKHVETSGSEVEEEGIGGGKHSDVKVVLPRRPEVTDMSSPQLR